MIISKSCLKIVPRPLKQLIKRVLEFISWDPWSNRSWSVEGEDLVLKRIFENQNSGFYIDVGAHHPKRFSNTYLLYRDGWRGINIDAMPGSMKLFQKLRPRDINLEVGVAEEEGKLNYYLFDEPALNGFSSVLSEERHTSSGNNQIKEILEIDVMPLSKIISNYIEECTIDFLNVDVEGLDLSVLKSNDWSRYRPKFVLVELIDSSLHELWHDDVTEFMNKQDYALYAKQVHTVFFKDLRA